MAELTDAECVKCVSSLPPLYPPHPESLGCAQRLLFAWLPACWGSTRTGRTGGFLVS